MAGVINPFSNGSRLCRGGSFNRLDPRDEIPPLDLPHRKGFPKRCSSWHRSDPTSSSFRWDPHEDVRYALLPGDPTASSYKAGTQQGANQRAAIGLAVVTVAPEVRAGRIRPAILAGSFGRSGFSFAWPIWRESASLSTIRALLAHPGLRKADELAYLGVDHVVATQRISVGKYMNFSRARRVHRT